MHEQPFFPNPTSPEPPKTLGRLRKKPLLVAVIFIILLFGALVAGLSYKHSRRAEPTPASSERSLVLYYRDGKTIFWPSDKINDYWNAPDQPGFARFVIDELKEKIGYDKLKQGAWRVTTTLDAPLQATATQQLAAQQKSFDTFDVANAAVIAEDITNGQVVSWVDGLENQTDSSDMITQKTEVGTLALPLTYAALIDHSPSMTADTMLDDKRQPLPGYPCTNLAHPNLGGDCLYNFDNIFAEQMPLRQALGTLRLVPAITASKPLLGPTGDSGRLQTFAERLTNNGKFACYDGESPSDTSSEVSCYTAAIFGKRLFATPQDMLTAYATLANNGKKSVQSGVVKAVVDGKTAYEWRPQSAKQVMREPAARVVNGILADSQASYLPEKYRSAFSAGKGPVGVAIGVSYERNKSTSVGTIQFSSKYAVGVWAVGGQQGIKTASELLVLPVGNEWMRASQ